MTLTGPPEFGSPKATVTNPQDGRTYTVNFKVKEGCETYTTNFSQNDSTADMACGEAKPELNIGIFKCELKKVYIPQTASQRGLRVALEVSKSNFLPILSFPACKILGKDHAEGNVKMTVAKLGTDSYEIITEKYGVGGGSGSKVSLKVNGKKMTYYIEYRFSKDYAKMFSLDKISATYECDYADHCK
ncbi:hypothetical protein HZC08_01465 [Candidatus Micrarchaeota archaeon]|nr:hypothetical protein [Candidatus Micrarchaeota archaeon]